MNSPELADHAQRKAKFQALRAEVFERAKTGTHFGRPRQVLSQLQGLKHRDWHLDWLETAIVFDCHRRAKPARTHGLLNQLKNICQEQGEEARFDVFFEFIKNILKPQFITPHGYCTTFSERPAKEIFAALEQALTPLFGFDYPVMLYAGALLGYVRDGALIGHDDDIDVAIYLGDHPAADIPALWIGYKTALHDKGLIAENSSPNKSSIFKLTNDLGIDVDLFPCWTCNGRFSVFPYSLDALETGDIFPLKPFSDAGLGLPSNPQSLLRQSYGESWQVPDPLFHFDWSDAMKRFAFLTERDYSLPALHHPSEPQ